ncbi:MAG: hypothetical protein O3B13_14640, partial [Planctomycetota bacterium]|nr:hypothetical protein [Planctomycetota bacterium]
MIFVPESLKNSTIFCCIRFRLACVIGPARPKIAPQLVSQVFCRTAVEKLITLLLYTVGVCPV